MYSLKYLPDRFTCFLIGVIIFASIFPAVGHAGMVLDNLTGIIIFLLFFLHGIKLSRPAIFEGIGNWKIQIIVTVMTFGFFPLLGWMLQPVIEPTLGRDLYIGVLFLCAVPATVQSAITLTALANGNMPAAICSASASTLMGILITPLLISFLTDVQHVSSSSSYQVIGKVSMQLLLPFVIGHMLRPWLNPFVQKNVKRIKIIDQGAILLVVYSAFSGAVLAGIWNEVSFSSLMVLVMLCAIILMISMGTCILLSRYFGFSSADEAVILFCGAQKSLVSGVPMAKLMFATPMVGLIILPLMIFHPMQLIVSSVIAGRYRRIIKNN